MSAARKQFAHERRLLVAQNRDKRPVKNPKKIRVWQKLRLWKKRDRRYHNFDNVYELSALLGQIVASRVRPMHLDEFGVLKPIRAQLLGWVVVTCLQRQNYAVCGTRAQWGELLHCHPNTFDTHRDWLIGEGWIKLIPDFTPFKSQGRKGESLNNRMMANWYGPGWRLLQAWNRYSDGLARLVEPIEKKSISVTASAVDQNCDPSSSTPNFFSNARSRARSVSPTAKEDHKPPSSASGAQGPASESPTATKEAPTAQVVLTKAPTMAEPIDPPVQQEPSTPPERPTGAAYKGGRARTVPPADGPAVSRAPGTEPKSVNDIALIANANMSIREKRELMAIYARNPETARLCLSAFLRSGGAEAKPS